MWSTHRRWGKLNSEKTLPELTVGRINVVDDDGTLRMVIANRDSFPTECYIGKGRTVHHERRGPGILFFNDDGAECGGLLWGGSVDDRQGGMSLTFDQIDQDQVVGLQYIEEGGRRCYGLTFWDRPDNQSIAELFEGAARVRAMPDGPDKKAAWKDLTVGHARRIFMGKDVTGDAMVSLSDSNGNTRIRLVIGKDNQPHIELLDEQGTVVWSMPPV